MLQLPLAMHSFFANLDAGIHVDPRIWSIAELCTAVVSACLPTLRPLFTRHPDDAITSDSKSRRKEVSMVGPSDGARTPLRTTLLDATSVVFETQGIFGDDEERTKRFTLTVVESAV